VSADPQPVEPGSEHVETKGQRTRRRILDAARRVFADVGYERATIRAIASAAAVDKSSINQYFGTKAELFAEAVRWHIPFERLAGATAAETVENHLRGMLRAWAADPNSPMAVLIRTSMTSVEAADILRAHLTERIIPELAATTDAADARQRAALVTAVMMGIASQRFLLGIPDLADQDPDDLVRMASPALRALIDPDAGSPTHRRPRSEAPSHNPSTAIASVSGVVSNPIRVNSPAGASREPRTTLRHNRFDNEPR
jgi:AcrR family transcriptional regulator